MADVELRTYVGTDIASKPTIDLTEKIYLVNDNGSENSTLMSTIKNGVAQGFNVVYVEKEEDYGPLGTEGRELATDTTYIRTAFISSVNALVLPNNGRVILTALNDITNRFEYSGTGAAIRTKPSESVSLYIHQNDTIRTTNLPTPQGTAFDIDVSQEANIDFVAFVGFLSLGNITGAPDVYLNNLPLFLFRNPMIINNCIRSKITDCNFVSEGMGTTHLLEITGINTTSSIISRNTFTTGQNEDAIKLDTNIPITSSIEVIDSPDGGDGGYFEASGLNQKSINVNSFNNGIAPNSKNIGSFTMVGNTLVTALTQNQWEVINGVTVASPNIERWTQIANSTLRYDSLQPFSGKCTGSASIENANSGTQTFEIGVFKKPAGGSFSLIAESQFPFEASGSLGSAVPISFPLEMNVDDEIQFRVRNIDNNNDLIIRYISIDCS